MRVALKYQRLPKPRGGWRFGLTVEVRVEYKDAEWQALAPYWTIEVKLATPLYFYTLPRRGSGYNEYLDCVRLRVIDSRRELDRWICSWSFSPWVSSGIVYFDSEADRNRAIELGRTIADRARQAAMAFWHENAPVEGDEAPIEEVSVFDEDQSDQQEVMRRIRLPAR